MQSHWCPARPELRAWCRAAGMARRRMNMHRQTSSAPADSLTASEQASFWVPLRHRLFVGLWLACAIANLAIWMQTVGAAWIMTQLTASPLMVSVISRFLRVTGSSTTYSPPWSTCMACICESDCDWVRLT